MRCLSWAKSPLSTERNTAGQRFETAVVSFRSCTAVGEFLPRAPHPLSLAQDETCCCGFDSWKSHENCRGRRSSGSGGAYAEARDMRCASFSFRTARRGRRSAFKTIDQLCDAAIELLSRLKQRVAASDLQAALAAHFADPLHRLPADARSERHFRHRDCRVLPAATGTRPTAEGTP